MSERLNLMDTIAKSDMFSAFARMLRTSGATEILEGTGQYTIFAPTNDAFGKVPDEMMNGLISEKDQVRLKALLSYHIVPGKLFVANLQGRSPLKTITGDELIVTDVSGMKINASGMQARNIEATNGVIHGLDTVLTPPAAVAPVTTAAVEPEAIAPATAAAPAADAAAATATKLS